MGDPLRLLHVEDSADDSVLIVEALKKSGFTLDVVRIQTAASMRIALQSQHWDIVLSDYSMPQFTAVDALHVLHESGLDVPFIIVSGTIGEEAAVEALRSGAHDFLLKDRLARLVPAVNRELREAARRRDHRSATEALRETEIEYQRLVDTAQEGIWLTNADGRALYANRRMAEMLGATGEQLLGRSIADFECDAPRRPTGSGSGERLATADAGYESRFRRLDGSEFWVHVTSSAMHDEHGRIKGGLSMVTDISEQKALQTQLMASDRMATVGLLAAGVAHEINNPLTAVMGNIELALLELSMLKAQAPNGQNLDRLEAELRDAEEAALRVRDVVRDIKIFSRTPDAPQGPVRIHDVLESSLRMASNEVRHRARLVKQFGPVPLIDGDEAKLGQVFINLLVNAAQSIPEGRAENNEIRLTTRTDGRGRAVVEVTDSGQGMSPEVVKRLFSPFFTTKPKGVGTGLGLSICKAIVTAHGGEIEVETSIGVGSTFRVVLPAGLRTIAASADIASSGPRASRRGWVLVIDDEHLITDLVQGMLRGTHEVAVANNAGAALALLDAGERFDVVLCDLMMPDVTGMDFHAEVSRRHPDMADRIVFLTGGAFTQSSVSFLGAITNPSIEKPFRQETLLRLVNEQVLREPADRSKSRRPSQSPRAE